MIEYLLKLIVQLGCCVILLFIAFSIYFLLVAAGKWILNKLRGK